MSTMSVKKNILQFTPYSSPHIWGVEKVVEWIFWKWTYWKSFIYSWNKCQEWNVYYRKTENKVDTHKKIFFPWFDIVDNFFIPQIWTKKYISSQKKLKQELQKIPLKEVIIITHTRFFLTSFFGGKFARKHNFRWIHIEHGSNYVQLSSKCKSFIAYLYDKTLGRWVIRNADRVICISQGAQKFVSKEFSRTDTQVWYRWIDIPKIWKKKWNIVFWYVGRLVSLKWVSDALYAFSQLETVSQKFIIIWDGPEKKNLIELAQTLWIEEKIEFLWQKSEEEVQEFLSLHNVILINPSYQEGMPTTVIEGLSTKNVVVATDVWGTGEISSFEDLVLFRPGDVSDMKKKLQEVYKNYFDLQGKSYTHIQKTFSREQSIQRLFEMM